MDKFTKTTEIDMSEYMYIEDDTPKKSTFWKVFSIIACAIIALIIWIYVSEIDSSLYNKEIKNVSFESLEEGNYIISSDDFVNVTVNGTKSEIADIKKSNITIEPEDGWSSLGVGEHEIEITCKLPSDSKATIVKTNKDTIKVIIKNK